MAETEPPLPMPAEKWQEIAARLKFSPTQQDVVEHILRNRCNKQIEHDLDLRHGTLRTHLDRIFRKAQVEDRQELVILLCAMSHGICRPQG